MKKLLEWIGTHIFLTLVLCILAFAVPLVVVHALFTTVAPHNWLVATWTAGELLAYIAGFEALLGTVILGFVTVYQSDKANEANERLNKENNYLQKISIQQMLPLLKVSDVIVHKTMTRNHQRLWNSSVVTVSEVGTTDKREPHINVYLPLSKNGQCYCKRIELTLENISSGPIRQIVVDKVEFSGFKYKNTHVGISTCKGMEKANYISWLVLPGNQLKVMVDIYCDNPVYRDFWEYDDVTEFGCLDICFYITNKSLSGIEYKEKIHIEKCANFKESIMYKAYEGDIENA